MKNTVKYCEERRTGKETNCTRLHEIEISTFYQRIEGLDMEQFVFVDETAKGASSARRRRGWVVKGSDAASGLTVR